MKKKSLFISFSLAGGAFTGADHYTGSNQVPSDPIQMEWTRVKVKTD